MEVVILDSKVCQNPWWLNSVGHSFFFAFFFSFLLFGICVTCIHFIAQCLGYRLCLWLINGFSARCDVCKCN